MAKKSGQKKAQGGVEQAPPPWQAAVSKSACTHCSVHAVPDMMRHVSSMHSTALGCALGAIHRHIASERVLGTQMLARGGGKRKHQRAPRTHCRASFSTSSFLFLVFFLVLRVRLPVLLPRNKKEREIMMYLHEL